MNGQVVVRPMMYVALSYDHRIVDGREAVQFLVKIKEYIEDPGHAAAGKLMRAFILAFVRLCSRQQPLP